MDACLGSGLGSLGSCLGSGLGSPASNLILPFLNGGTGEDGVDEAVVFIDLRGGDAGLFTGVDDETDAAPPHLDGLAEVEHLGDGRVARG